LEAKDFRGGNICTKGAGEDPTKPPSPSRWVTGVKQSCSRQSEDGALGPYPGGLSRSIRPRMGTWGQFLTGPRTEPGPCRRSVPHFAKMEPGPLLVGGGGQFGTRPRMEPGAFTEANSSRSQTRPRTELGTLPRPIPHQGREWSLGPLPRPIPH